MKDITDKQVIQAYLDARDEPPGAYPYDVLMERTGECFKVCYRCMERASDRDLVDYGVSLRSGWVTEKGMELLNESEG